MVFLQNKASIDSTCFCLVCVWLGSASLQQVLLDLEKPSFVGPIW